MLPHRRLLTVNLLFMTTLASLMAAERPSILWTPAEVAAIRHRLDHDPIAQQQWQRTLALSPRPPQVEVLNALLHHDNAALRQSLIRRLTGSIGHKPEPLTWDVDPATLQWNEGMPSAGDRHMRDERSPDAFIYDAFVDLLTDEQRAGVETYFRSYIDFHLAGHPPRHPHFRYDRTSWLPNMHWPRPIGTHLLALALHDRDAIEALFKGDGGWKWYFDDYLTDQGFYMEEFGKFYSNTGAMIAWCEGLERLGLSEMGYDYVGRTGITMRSHLRANTLDLAYPATDWGGGMPTYARVTMGDAKGSTFPNGPIQHAVVRGYLPDGTGGNREISNARMNGPMPKLLEPYWFEAGQARWPEDGYDFFLAALRAPDDEVYLPTLLFNLEPVDPAAVQPPVPTPSYLARQRGFAFLRADHSRNYWTGPKPAVALQCARYYVHYVHDCMSLLGLHAFNAPLVVNGWGTGRGYAGGNAWRDSVRGHSGVVVDNLQAKPVARGFDGTQGHRYRDNLDQPDNPLAIRFVAVRADGVYPEVDHERALILAADYLFDVTWLRQQGKTRPRTFEWQVLSPCSSETGESWQPSDAVGDGALYQGSPFEERLRGGSPDPLAVRRLEAGDGPWSLRLAYQSRNDDPSQDRTQGAFATRGVGMDLHVLGADDTEAFVGVPPGAATGPGAPTWLMIRRQTPATVFAVLYAPFQGRDPAVTSLELIARNEHGLAVRVSGQRPDGHVIDDLILLRHGDDPDQILELTAEGFAARFRDHAVIRLSDADRPHIGDLIDLRWER